MLISSLRNILIVVGSINVVVGSKYHKYLHTNPYKIMLLFINYVMANNLNSVQLNNSRQVNTPKNKGSVRFDYK